MRPRLGGAAALLLAACAPAARHTAADEPRSADVAVAVAYEDSDTLAAAPLLAVRAEGRGVVVTALEWRPAGRPLHTRLVRQDSVLRLVVADDAPVETVVDSALAWRWQPLLLTARIAPLPPGRYLVDLVRPVRAAGELQRSVDSVVVR